MASGDLGAIRAALVRVLSTIPGLKATTRFGDVGPSVALVGLPSRILYDESADGDTYTLPIKLLCTNDEGGHDDYISYLAKTGPTSVKEAIESDPTLGGTCDSVRVTELIGTASDFDALSASVVTADWLVEIFA